MTDAQTVAIAITVLAVLGGTLINNTRFGDAKDVLRAETHKELAQLRLDFTERFNSIDRKLDEMLRLLADHESRLRTIEERAR